MLCARAGNALRYNFSLLRDKSHESFLIFVINVYFFVIAETAAATTLWLFLFWHYFPLQNLIGDWNCLFVVHC